MVYKDNPAGRLHVVLSKLTQVERSAPLPAAWASVFEVHQTESIELTRRIVTVMELAVVATREVRAVATDEGDAVLTQWIDPVTTSMGSATYATATATMTDRLTESVLFSLAAASRELHRLAPEGLLDGASQEAALEVVAELLETLRHDPDLDPATREILLRQAAALQLALNIAWVSGPVAVREALFGAMGVAKAVFTDKPDMEKTESGRSLWDKLQRIADLTSIADGSTAVALVATDLIPKLLGGG